LALKWYRQDLIGRAKMFDIALAITHNHITIRAANSFFSRRISRLARRKGVLQWVTQFVGIWPRVEVIIPINEGRGGGGLRNYLSGSGLGKQATSSG